MRDARGTPAAARAAALRAAQSGGTLAALYEELVQATTERVLAVLRAEQQQAQQQWLTTAEAAEYLRVPVSRLYRAISMRGSAKRPIPLHKDGAHNFFLASELDAWRRAGGAG